MKTRLTAAAFLLTLCARSQILVDPATPNGAAAVDLYRNALATKPSLRCQIASAPLWHGFDFRTWSGYRIQLPAAQFQGQPSEMAIFARVRPKNEPAKEYLFFTGRFGLLAVPEPKRHDFYFDGGFYLGPGGYDVDLLAIDRSSRVCRKDWSVKTDGGKVEGGLPPNTASGFTSNRWRGFPPGEERRGRVTVLLHAAPIVRRRYSTKLSPVDRMILLNSLVSLLNRSRYASARVVAFDIDGRRIVYEAEDFTPRSYRALTEALNKMDFGTIGIDKLNRERPDKLLAGLLEREHKAKEQSERIVFLGPAHRFAGKMLAEVREIKLELPPTYYLTFSYLRLSPDDWIDNVVKKIANGKTIPISSPQDLSKAIARIQGLAQ